MPSDIVQRLEASIRFDAINGDAHERNVCKRQMAEAIAELNRLKRHISTTDAALQESVQLQSHYAKLLNQYDGGARMVFTVESWMDRLAALDRKGA